MIDRTVDNFPVDDILHLEKRSVTKGPYNQDYKPEANHKETLECLCTVVSRLCDAVDEMQKPTDKDTSEVDNLKEELKITQRSLTALRKVVVGE